MEISLDIKNLTSDVGAKYLMETGSTNPVPPRGQIVQNLNEATARLKGVLSKWLVNDYTSSADDELSIAQVIVFELALTPRRASNKAQLLADLIHSFYVNAVLAKVYVSASQSEFAKQHDAQMTADLNAIENAINSKTPPTL